MLLILGDWTRALWYLVFAIVSFKRGTIYTHTRVCQIAGYLIQMATEISGQALAALSICVRPLTRADLSVLFISIHGATQIFKPPVSIAGGDDRLYKYRHWIYAFILLVPQIFASLPFADPRGAGYLSQGAFCTLPIRPIWYRLVLAWIPRLCIWFTILGLAIAIYTHVHREFSNFSEAFRHHSTTSTSFLSETLDGSPPMTERRRGSSPDIGLHRPSVDRGDQAPDVTSASADVLTRPRPAHTRQISSVDPISTNDTSPNALPLPTTGPPEGRRNSRVRIEVPASPVGLGPESEPGNPSGKRKSFSESLRSWRGPSKEAYDNQHNRSSLPNSLYSERQTPSRNSVLALFSSSRRVSDGAKSMSSGRSRIRSRTFSSTSRAERKPSRRVSDPMEAQMRHKRAHIRRQLRQVFVYPLVYICMWLMPFVALCITYNSKLAKRPPFIINTLNNFCLCFIGAVNSIVFSLRERPWRHIEGNPSRRFWSSFCFGCNKDDDLEYDDDSLPSHRQRRHSNRWSGSTCVTNNTTAPTEDRPAVSATLLRPQLVRSATAPPSPANPITSIQNDEKDDEDTITPVSPLTPPSPTSRQGLATTSPPLLAPPPPPLISRTSLPPPPRHTPTDSPAAASSPSPPSPPPPSANHPTSTLSALSLATSAARRHIKRASVIVAASATATRETDAQRAAREMAYERLAWEREQHAAAARLTTAAAAAAAAGSSSGGGGGPRRGSTGDIVGGDGGVRGGSRSGGGSGGGGGGGGDGTLVAGSLGSRSWAGTGPAGVGTREWWERRGSEWGTGRSGSRGDGGGGVNL